MAIFGYSEFIPVFLGKIVSKNSEWYKFGMVSLFRKNYQKKFGTAIFGHSKFMSFWEKLSEKIKNGHFWPFRVFPDNFSVHITLIECNGLESNEKFFEKKLSGKTFLSKKKSLEKFSKVLKFGNVPKFM